MAQHEPIVANAGFWSALGIVVGFAVFTVCFVAIPLTAPFYLWTDLATYLVYRREHGQVYQPAALLAMLLFGPLVVILLGSIHDYAREGSGRWPGSASVLGTHEARGLRSRGIPRCGVTETRLCW